MIDAERLRNFVKVIGLDDGFTEQISTAFPGSAQDALGNDDNKALIITHNDMSINIITRNSFGSFDKHTIIELINDTNSGFSDPESAILEIAYWMDAE